MVAAHGAAGRAEVLRVVARGSPEALQVLGQEAASQRRSRARRV